MAGQHLAVHGAQFRTWLGAEFGDQAGPSPLVGGERVALPARAIQREHEQHPEVLTQRMSVGELPQLLDQLGVTPQAQTCVDPGLLSLQPHLGQSRHGAPQERF